MSAIKTVALTVAPSSFFIGDPTQFACHEVFSDGTVMFAVASGAGADWVYQSFVECMKDIKTRSGKPFASTAPTADLRNKWLMGMVQAQCVEYLTAVGAEEGIAFDLNVIWGVLTVHGWGMAAYSGSPANSNLAWGDDNTCEITGDIYISAGEAPTADYVFTLLKKRGEEKAAIALDEQIKSSDYVALFAAINPNPAKVEVPVQEVKAAVSAPVITKGVTPTPVKVAKAEATIVAPVTVPAVTPAAPKPVTRVAPVTKSNPVVIKEQSSTMSDLQKALAALKAAENEVSMTRATLAIALQEHEDAIANLAVCKDHYARLEAKKLGSVAQAEPVINAPLATGSVAETVTCSAMVWVGNGSNDCRTLSNTCENVGVLPTISIDSVIPAPIESIDLSAEFAVISKGLNLMVDALANFNPELPTEQVVEPVAEPVIEVLDIDDEMEEVYIEILSCEEVVEQTAAAVEEAKAAVDAAEANYATALALVKKLEAQAAAEAEAAKVEAAKVIAAPVVVAPVAAIAAPAVTHPVAEAVVEMAPTSKVPAVRGVQVRAIKLYQSNGANPAADKAINAILAATNSAVAMVAMKDLEAAYGIVSTSSGKQTLSGRGED